MNSQLRGELYISTSGDVNVPEDFYEELKKIPGIGGIDIFRNVPITFRGKPASIISIDASVLPRDMTASAGLTAVARTGSR